MTRHGGSGWLEKLGSGHLVNRGESEGILSHSGIRLPYSVGSAHGPTAYEVFDSTTVPDPSNGGCLWTEAFRLHPAIVCAEICGAGRCHGPS